MATKIFTVQKKRPDFHMWNCSRSSHTYKLVIVTMQQPPFIVSLLTFDKYCWTAVRNRCSFDDKGHYGGGSQPKLQEAKWLTEDDDRMICHGNQEQFRCSRLVSHIHKKLLLGRWCILVDSVKLRRIFYLQQRQLAHRQPELSFQVIVTSTHSRVHQPTTATIHKTSLDIYSEAGLCQ